MVCLNLDIIYPAYLRYRYGVLEERSDLTYLAGGLNFREKSLLDFAISCKKRDWGRVVVNFDLQDVKELLELEVNKGNLIREKDKFGNNVYSFNVEEKGMPYLTNMITDLTDNLPYYHPYILYALDLQKTVTLEEIEDFRCFS